MFLHRHVSGKSEALREVEKIYDAVRDGTFGRESAATLTLRLLGERYFKAYVSPKTGRPLGTERTLPLERDDRNEGPRPPARGLHRR